MSEHCEFCKKELSEEKLEHIGGCLDCAGMIYLNQRCDKYICVHCIEIENAKLKEELAKVDTPKLFPIQDSSKIPWSIADKAYGAYRKKYGSSQSLERLAERGGFYSSEMDELYPSWRTESSEITQLKSDLAEAIEVVERSAEWIGCCACFPNKEWNFVREFLGKVKK